MMLTGMRQVMFPYLMQKNDDGSWTFLNRHYKPVGLNTDRVVTYDDPDHRVMLRGLTVAHMRALAAGSNDGDEVGRDTTVIHLYGDDTAPERSRENMEAYLQKLAILMRL